MQLDAEWLEADTLGGFASGTVGLLRTRRYHALLMAATPAGRFVLVNGMEVWAQTPGGRYALSSHAYQPDTLYPDGRSHLATFDPAPWPAWSFHLPDGTTIRHELLAVRATKEVVLRWKADRPVRLEVRLLLSGRDYHALHRENPAFDFTTVHGGGGAVAWRPYPGVPAVTARGNFGWTDGPDWYRRFTYAQEVARGLDDGEDLASPGILTFDGPGDAVLVLRAETPGATAVSALTEAERARRERPAPDVAADAYLAARAAGPNEGTTVMAGFPWFTDWGRDTFIAMRGLLLATGRLGEARAVLLAWAGAVDGGMLPNRFPDSGEAPEFNAVDASLWFVVAVHDTLDACAAAGEPVPPAEADRLRTAAEAILSHYARGTRFGIRAEADGLLHAGAEGVQLTWMDAITDGHVVTPRRGKPVEVQALWINALEIAAARWSDHWAAPAAKARAAFAARFPHPSGGLYDVADVEGEPGRMDDSLRPNQIFAVGGLPFPILSGAAARAVVDRVEARLLTPLGLRTLSPDDPRYIPRYRGDLVRRDAAYHQGTAWPWLLGPFVEAWLRVRGGAPAAKAEAAARFLAPLMRHLDANGLGHVSEVVDGEAPHHAGGCPLQAWSLGELIRIRRMLDLDV